MSDLDLIGGKYRGSFISTQLQIFLAVALTSILIYFSHEFTKSNVNMNEQGKALGWICGSFILSTGIIFGTGLLANPSFSWGASCVFIILFLCFGAGRIPVPNV